MSEPIAGEWVITYDDASGVVTKVPPHAAATQRDYSPADKVNRGQLMRALRQAQKLERERAWVASEVLWSYIDELHAIIVDLGGTPPEAPPIETFTPEP